ncbi:MAG: hypothetical protein LAT63_09280 [Marinobacter sp.]|nr:hypothetical protein [Marinobacter sp.]
MNRKLPSASSNSQGFREPLPDLIARLRIRHSFFKRETVEARLFELDQYGCVFKTDKVFEPGDTVAFDLIMAMPFDSIRANALQGLVVERTKHCSNFFYAIDFIDRSHGQGADIKEKLERIRDVLEKKKSLRSRRTGQSFNSLA